ncbi:MAG TPA: hypothetical protein VMV10_27320 [Pirellulales bacterium]|nr:hypothetical protein [Pirellulales bacterium]
MAALIASMSPQVSSGKNPNHRPDVTDEKFWTTYNASIVRVTSIDRGDDGRNRVALEPLIAIVGKAGVPSGTVRENDLWFGLARHAWPKIKVGDQLLIMYKADKWPAMVVAEVIEGDAASSPQASALLRIAAISAAGLPRAELQSAALEDNVTLAAFCLKRLLAEHASELPAEYVPQLRRRANNEAVHPTARLLSFRLGAVVAAKGDAAIADEDERHWLCASIRDAKACDFLQLLPLVRRLAEFPQDRRENVEFLTATVADVKLRKETRSAAADPLTSEALFHFKSPDAASDQIHRTFVSLLADDDKDLRVSAAGHLEQIACQSNPQGAAARYIKASRDAIRTALAVETDEIAKFHLKTDIETIDFVSGQSR